MSADNIIAIAKFPDGFRVAHTQAIENITDTPKGSAFQKKQLRYTFKKSKVFTQENAAFLEAQRLEKQVEDSDGFVEQGICFIGIFDKF